jgi:CDP-paratose 2-epimerase
MTKRIETAGVAGATVLVTGGAGFVGAHLAVRLAESGARVIALDNLRRRGSELNLGRLREARVTFVHGDVRIPSDLMSLGSRVDWLIDCAAEPSVMSGHGDDGRYVVETNLVGSLNCLELARRDAARVVFLSTSRVYSTARLNALRVTETETRFVLADAQDVPGASGAGIAETFPTDGARTLYGASKLGSELLLTEYGDIHGVEFVVNRLGVIAGPGQMGKVEQGVFSLFMARHVFGGSIRLIGWGGSGKQVRDVLHVEDVWDLVALQMTRWSDSRGRTFNAGGGAAVSLSLQETLALCEELTGVTAEVHRDASTRHGDVRVYLTDHAALTAALGWRPRRDAPTVLRDLRDWMEGDRDRLRTLFA